jgi:hypothetical protein
VSFGADIKRFSDKVQIRSGAVFTETMDECLRSIQTGSEISGAPGQPVDTGALRASWQKFFISPMEARIGTNIVYAQSIEDGLSYAHGGTPITQRSSVGGFHSVKLTIAAFARIVEIVTRRVNGAASTDFGKDYSGSMPSGFNSGGTA